ncbi:hypothetical protein DDB_G0286001 [Dictyostelium discoideum AX4]|uniref:Putative uncharacterized protein DDB_G0286001 n=1 Tax=Dictyostelium discoideum TaxID=44689 RepID=Y8776_DICDI|nr:hypothetical protein DDB_G0286001 [Dictyostelium discoideum AX4]Q54MF2.1 RecName: Full=Putative uncharacterized protein DDB_G0286001 [Dictyostelium discoideum]EAL64442.1 hypothetical protein DDB_G0286001 [Dictyostelium discoideum AX4]|eukprot:XP_637945.1 hypothetical protein DDB_G0286001 [Dictyostelium discoideum AX4]
MMLIFVKITSFLERYIMVRKFKSELVRISSESLPPQLRIEVEKQIITDVAHCMELVRKIENANISIYDKSLYTGKSVQNQFTTYNANNDDYESPYKTPKIKSNPSLDSSGSSHYSFIKAIK